MINATIAALLAAHLNYTPVPKVEPATCNTYCYPEQRDSWGNVTRHAYCTTRCY